MIRAVGVVVPAHDEQHTIGACLDALHRAAAHLHCRHPGVFVRIAVVLDACTDGTETVVARDRRVVLVRTAAQRVGAARAAGASHLLRRIAAARQETWLANTDADSTVPPGWLSGMLAHAARGAELVLGTVTPAPGLPTDVVHGWSAAQTLRDDHPHVHGANFGIRADTYLQLGGWPELVTGEDTALAARAAAARRPIRRSATMPVCTSTRLTGRAPHGFSSYLRGLTGRSFPVPPAGRSARLPAIDGSSR